MNILKKMEVMQVLKIKKIVILLLLTLLVSGCSTSEEEIKNETLYIGTEVRVDKETCVEYIRVKEQWNYGFVIVPRYNQDGTLRLNKKCLLEKVSDEE